MGIGISQIKSKKLTEFHSGQEPPKEEQYYVRLKKPYLKWEQNREE